MLSVILGIKIQRKASLSVVFKGIIVWGGSIELASGGCFIVLLFVEKAFFFLLPKSILILKISCYLDYFSY